MFTLSNETYSATFDPERGMNMLSFRRGEIEAIAQSTRHLFDERNAGLGALIGPHFHHRPHADPEPFSHGIARQLPWQCEHTATTFSAKLESDDEIARKEGQAFTMFFDGTLTPEGLNLSLGVTSEANSVVGFHYYYALPGSQGTVRTGDKVLTLDQPYDDNFSPSNPLADTITLETDTHTLQVIYSCPNEWNSWQLWHPEGADFICIEPLSARNPRKPLLSVSSVSQTLSLS